jgi:glycosyltransferase involved in cell wall biosynthesis
MRRKKSALVVHPQFDMIGGAELVSLSVIEWLLLRGEWDVTLLSTGSFDHKEIARRTPFRLNHGNLVARKAYCPSYLKSSEAKFELLKLAFLHRSARRLAGEFDICISTYNELDFGKRSFQYIHFPAFAPRVQLQPYLGDEGNGSILDNWPWINRIYRTIVNIISGTSVSGFRRNVTAVNSNFVAGIVREAYGIESEVVYPAFRRSAAEGPIPCYEERCFQFVAISRIATTKNLFELFGLFLALKKSFPPARFVLIGRLTHPTILTELQRRAETLDLDLEIAVDASAEFRDEALRSSRFYLHSKRYEHFGISIVEAVSYGCIPFVPDSGGQIEIVTPAVLRFSGAGDLVEKVERVVKDSELRERVTAELNDTILNMSREPFGDQIGRLLQSNGLM